MKWSENVKKEISNLRSGHSLKLKVLGIGKDCDYEHRVQGMGEDTSRDLVLECNGYDKDDYKRLAAMA